MVDLTRIRPLPLKCRLHNGENARSYASRLCNVNGIEPNVIRDFLIETGALDARAWSANTLSIWRRLGDLDERAFTTPHVTAIDEWVNDRQLCRRCCAGSLAYGRLPHVGLICVRHDNWLNDLPGSLKPHSDQLAAEKRFRRRLAPLGMTFDGPEMTFSLVCAGRIAASTRIASEVRSTPRAMLNRVLYPIQVQIAAWLWTRLMGAGRAPTQWSLDRVSVELDLLLNLTDRDHTLRVSPLVRTLLKESSKLQVLEPATFGRLHPTLDRITW